jgi:hypothetical protein
MANRNDFQLIDISMKITNNLPMIKITDELTVTVNNRKSVVLNMQALAKELENKKDEKSQLEFMNKAMCMLIGKKNTQELENLDLPMPEYRVVYEAIMDIATGTYEEDTPIK